MLTIEVIHGLAAGAKFEFRGSVVMIGRRTDNQLVLEDQHVSGEHARIDRDGERFLISDLKSTNGTTIVRAGQRHKVGAAAAQLDLENGDVVELGVGDAITILKIAIAEDAGDDSSRVVRVTRIDEAAPAALRVEGDPSILSKLYAVQKTIGEGRDLEDVLKAVADASLELARHATHATIVLRDDDGTAANDKAVYVPVLTRVRLPSGEGGPPSGPVPVARSVYRKVIRERAGVLAADAPSEVGSESLMGASIRSTIGVPLWRGEEILGVLQVDNRNMPGVLSGADMEVLLALAANASLAVSNARLIKRLTLAEEQLKRENTFLKGREEKRRGKDVNIIGDSDAMKSIQKQLEKVVDTRVTVLIEGETGTGKELVAAAVHYRSKRRDKLFVAQNCAAISENLLESELFGHKRGAFTGANEDKKGLFEIADGGTLFLDEVNSTSLSLQSKLLRAIQEGEIRAVGATAAKHVDVRIVAATNRTLEDAVKAGTFREDLYYRLKVFPIRLPPLRERREDIPLIANHFLARYAEELGKPAGGFAQQALELLMSYDWPGNVRELQNEVQRVVIQLDPGAFATADLLSPHIKKALGVVGRANVTRGTLREMMDAVEKYLLLDSLREHGNNKTSAAKSLGITREGLHKKLRQHGIH